MSEVLLLAGSRPEAVKAAVVAVRLGDLGTDSTMIHCGLTMVEQDLAPFGLRAGPSLFVDQGAAGQAELVSQLLPALDEVLAREEPAVVVVQGDTTTALAGALAAFWRHIPVAHLEAGPRTGDLGAPFPGEANRQMIARLAASHLAPTAAAADAIRVESVCGGDIVVTGSTMADAVQRIAAADLPAIDPRLAALERELDATGAPLVLMTAHPRSPWVTPLEEVFSTVSTLVDACRKARLLLPMRLDPAVRDRMDAALGRNSRVVLTDPLAYPDFVRALRRASFVLTDSGDFEEAACFGVPVLALAENTDSTQLLAEAESLLDADRHMAVGQDNAAERVCAVLTHLVQDGAAVRTALLSAS